MNIQLGRSDGGGEISEKQTLWWIMPGILANQKRRNILNE